MRAAEKQYLHFYVAEIDHLLVAGHRRGRDDHHAAVGRRFAVGLGRRRRLLELRLGVGRITLHLRARVGMHNLGDAVREDEFPPV